MYLKTVYKNCFISPDGKWPPTPSKRYINLVLVKGGHRRFGEDSIADVALMQKQISIEQLLEQEGQNKLKLILLEGAPGIGKSALVWELCRKWEVFACMQQYSLVILLRLREEEVQKITNISQLFFSYTSDKDTLVQEVLRGNGKGILFILDGFDELPKQLQQKGFLLDLIRGKVLPESTVLLTSKPSATGALLTSCRRHVQKHVEILGFTREAVHAYASSIFSYEPKELEKFEAYISANPAINSLMYIPLNAAIIVTIYRNCNSILPHTLTELYTQLCLTILDRHLKSHHASFNLGIPVVEKFEDLPPDVYRQFLHLSEVAFEGFKNEEVIFHSVPSDLIHFGFLDAVSALYGGGTVSYNFLHLTVQEFLAAYYISNLGSASLGVLQRYGMKQWWNVVWRFVAGLTEFKQYEGHFDRDLFVQKAIGDYLEFKLFFFQCLFEAQSMKYFYSALESSSTTAVVKAGHLSSLDAYAIGYCISNFPIGISSWIVMINHSSHHSFRHGLNSALCVPEVELYVS